MKKNKLSTTIMFSLAMTFMAACGQKPVIEAKQTPPEKPTIAERAMPPAVNGQALATNTEKISDQLIIIEQLSAALDTIDKPGQPKEGQLLISNTSFVIESKAYFKVVDSELQLLTFWVKYLDDQDNVLWMDPFSIDVPDGLTPQDYLPLYLKYEGEGEIPPVAKLAFEVENLLEGEIVDAVAKPIKLINSEKSQKYGLKLEERFSSFTREDNGIIHHLSLRLQQSSKADIKFLKARLSYFDQDKKLLDQRPLTLLGAKDMPLNSQYPYMKGYKIKTRLEDSTAIGNYQIELLDIKE
ncbi:hypothetical protein PPO43_01915 [Saprospira sp. CCB-QB6]|uniref:hypothetical protein n=1 Tax=Saprospira sp. CCB-QB6 TaxID=3023936 RepID=UPI002349FF45|nr:hypothetical protein [Saprospira sp. CCB-QB6]WCL81853.1 hypothetical protein PPO43_01915 [Saprospira sp. CCB-QB6]